MKQNLRIKGLIIVGVVLICIYGIIGLPKSGDELVQNFEKNIRLGLDLKGGTQLVLQIQLQDAFKAEADSVIDRMKDALTKAGVEFGSIDRNDPSSIEEASSIQINVRGVPAVKAGNFRNIVADQFAGEWVMTPVNSTDYKLTMKASEALRLDQDTMAQSQTTIGKKIDALGLAEATVQERGGQGNDAELMVQLPGVDDPARVKGIIQTAAILEWYPVEDGPFSTREEALAKHGGILPLNTKLIHSKPHNGEGADTWYLVTRSPVITGRDLRDARASQGEMGRWETNFVLTQQAAKKFQRYTQSNIGNRAAIVLDGTVLSAPTIQSAISDTGRITGAATREEAQDLALNLRAGSLPAGVVVLGERSVGASLGADSIRDGIIAGVAGVIAVVFCMLVYYRRAGINATLALILNAVILIAALSYFGAALTLPGIAGVILTIGMAVDSNVLIFERIREELHAGKAVVAAVDAGFAKAFLTIIDTHVTTIVSCAFLFIFGTGPVQGFAVTLVIGLCANVFTAVFVSRVIFDWELSQARVVTELSI